MFRIQIPFPPFAFFNVFKFNLKRMISMEFMERLLELDSIDIDQY